MKVEANPAAMESSSPHLSEGYHGVPGEGNPPLGHSSEEDLQLITTEHHRGQIVFMYFK